MSIFNSKFFANASKSSCNWLGEQYKDTNLHNLPPMLVSYYSSSEKLTMTDTDERSVLKAGSVFVLLQNS